MEANLFSKTLIVQEVACPTSRAGTPLIFIKSKGAKLYSEVGKEYLDLQNGKGSVLLGHNHPAITKAICSMVENGEDVRTGYHPFIYEVAERLAHQVNQEAIAFFKTGTAAVKAATQAVMRETQNPIVLSAGYHGYDAFWHAAKNIYEPNPYGVVDFYYNLTILERVIHKYRGKIAAIVISPDLLHFKRDWYETARDIIESNQLTLICDEVKVGYRYRPGLITEQFGWKPHTAIISKGIANGFPFAAVLGPKVILSHLKTSTYTSFFDPLSFVAVKTTLDIVSSGSTHIDLEAIGADLITGLKKAFEAHQCPIDIVHNNGSLFQFVFGDKVFEDRFYEVALEEGIVFYVRDNQALSLAFNEVIIDEFFQRLDKIIQRLEGEFKFGKLLGPRIEHYYDAAWNLVDGLPDMKFPFSQIEKQLLRLREL